MERILTRVFQSILQKRPPPGLLQELAGSLVSQESHKKYNLGLLDLGGLVCRYVNPLCAECPLTSICDYYNQNKGKLIKEAPDRYETTIGVKLRELRKEKGIGLAKLSRISGVSKLTIIHIEFGRTSPRPETIARLATALGVKTEELIARHSEN